LRGALVAAVEYGSPSRPRAVFRGADASRGRVNLPVPGRGAEERRNPVEARKGEIMKLTRSSLASAVALALLASPAVSVSALAQDQPQAQPPAAAAPSPTQFDDTKLRSFAVAYLEVNKVAQTYQPQLQATKDPQEQQRIQTEAANGMVQAVENAEGITIEEYNTIVNSAQADPALAQKINTMVQEAAQTNQ